MNFQDGRTFVIQPDSVDKPFIYPGSINAAELCEWLSRMQNAIKYASKPDEETTALEEQIRAIKEHSEQVAEFLSKGIHPPIQDLIQHIDSRSAKNGLTAAGGLRREYPGGGWCAGMIESGEAQATEEDNSKQEAICQQAGGDLDKAGFTVLESAELMAKIMELVKKTSHDNGKKIPVGQLSQIFKALEILTIKA